MGKPIKKSGPLPTTKVMLIVFEALRRMGWPADNIFFINAIDARTGRKAVFVTLQDAPEAPAKFTFQVAFIDAPGALKAVFDDLEKYAKKWNHPKAKSLDDPAEKWRQAIWESRSALGFDDLKFSEILVEKGLNVGPEHVAERTN